MENMENMCLKCLENSYGCTTANHLTNRLEIHRLQTNIVGERTKFPESQSPGQIHSQKWDTSEPDQIYDFNIEKSKSSAFWSGWTPPAALMWLC